uniref:Uncharacterized protein n=1 Tax=Arundo donax TaxID=35708 RepID=A0A0A9CP20_ARUDO
MLGAAFYEAVKLQHFYSISSLRKNSYIFSYNTIRRSSDSLTSLLSFILCCLHCTLPCYFKFPSTFLSLTVFILFGGTF